MTMWLLPLGSVLLSGTLSLQWALALCVIALLAGYTIWSLVQRVLEKRRPSVQISAVTLLPKPVICCGGTLRFSAPMEFRLEKQQNGNAIFVGMGDVRLTVMRLPLDERIRIRTLTGTEIQRYFGAAIPMRNTPEVSYSFHAHSPALTAWWQTEPVGTLACMHLIQVPEGVYFMQFTGLHMGEHSFVEPMLYSVEVQPERKS